MFPSTLKDFFQPYIVRLVIQIGGGRILSLEMHKEHVPSHLLEYPVTLNIVIFESTLIGLSICFVIQIGMGEI